MNRSFDVLNLERESVSFLPLAWTLVHSIDENSPLFGLSETDLENLDAEVLVVISATNETFAQIFYTRSSYKSKEIKFDYKFSNLYNEIETGKPVSIDIGELSKLKMRKRVLSTCFYPVIFAIESRLFQQAAFCFSLSQFTN